jgi:hypothetical protein
MDGWKQQLYKTKAKVSSLTLATESVMLSCTIDAKEHHDVAVCDVSRAFMQADIDEIIHIWLDGEMAELVCKIDSSLYERYMVQEGHKKAVIYLCLSKAL